MFIKELNLIFNRRISKFIINDLIRKISLAININIIIIFFNKLFIFIFIITINKYNNIKIDKKYITFFVYNSVNYFIEINRVFIVKFIYLRINNNKDLEDIIEFY